MCCLHAYEWVRKTAVKIVCVNDENPKASKQASRQSKQFTGKKSSNKSGNCRALVVVRRFSIFTSHSLSMSYTHSYSNLLVCVYARIWEYCVDFVRVYERAFDFDAANSLLHLNSCRCTSAMIYVFDPNIVYTLCEYMCYNGIRTYTHTPNNNSTLELNRMVECTMYSTTCVCMYVWMWRFTKWRRQSFSSWFRKHTRTHACMHAHKQTFEHTHTQA